MRLGAREFFSGSAGTVLHPVYSASPQYDAWACEPSSLDGDPVTVVVAGTMWAALWRDTPSTQIGDADSARLEWPEGSWAGPGTLVATRRRTDVVGYTYGGADPRLDVGSLPQGYHVVPVYSQNPAFTFWTCTPSDVEVAEGPGFRDTAGSPEPSHWAITVMTEGVGVELYDYGPQSNGADANATTLTFPRVDPTPPVVFTRTRTDVVRYELAPDEPAG